MPRRNHPKRTSAEKAAAIQTYREAKKALHSLPPSDEETPEYTRRNSAVLAAESSVPWWRR
jgi:hypothetical protein